MRGVGVAVVIGWLFLSPIVVHQGSEVLARSPLASDTDGDVRWVARAVDPSTRELNRNGQQYWYFSAAPTLEIRVFRDTDEPVQLVSFEIDNARNVDSNDVGERVTAPIALGRSHGFEVWPADETKPISFRFTAQYHSGRVSSTFRGTVAISGVIPGDIRDSAPVKSVPVSQALQVATAGASFSETDDAQRRQQEHRQLERARRQQKRAMRDQQRAQERQQREQERARDRQNAESRAAREADQRRQMSEQRVQLQQQKHEAEQRRLQELERQRQQTEAWKRQQTERQRQQHAQNQPTQTARQQAPAPQPRGCPNGTVEYDPCQGKPNCNKPLGCRYPKQTIEVNAHEPVVVGPPPAEQPRESITTEPATTGEMRWGRQCPEGYTLVGRCPYEKGVRCAHGGYCKPDFNKVAKKDDKPRTSSGSSGSDSPSNQRPSSDGSTTVGDQSPAPGSPSSGDDEKIDHCPGPADERRASGTCVEVVEAKYISECSDGAPRFKVKVRNRCNMRIYMSITLYSSGKYNSEAAVGLRPGKTHTASTCEATGKWDYSAVFSPKAMEDWNCSDW